MNLPTSGWKNKGGTGNRYCNCGSWKNHWINNSKLSWPSVCSIAGCYNIPTLGAHIYNRNVQGEYIVPACDSCNRLSGEFYLKLGVTLVPANKQLTCS